jgi:hypothetical protein
MFFFNCKRGHCL